MNPPYHWSHKVNDLVAAGVGGSVLAAINLASLEAWLQIILLVLSILFMSLGVLMRSERFVRRMSRAFYGEPLEAKEEDKEEE